VAKHAEDAFENGAEIYIASVAKSMSGVDQANKRLAAIANRYSTAVLLSNCIGPSEGFESAGHSAVWNANGQLLKQLDDKTEGIIIYDSDTQELILT
jgi:predicted amidohydrolase